MNQNKTSKNKFCGVIKFSEHFELIQIYFHEETLKQLKTLYTFKFINILK